MANCKFRNDSGDVPELKAQFFYSSPIAIDDPLFVLPAGATKFTPLPFSEYDNEALEKKWQAYWSSSTQQASQAAVDKDISLHNQDDVSREEEIPKQDRREDFTASANLGEPSVSKERPSLGDIAPNEEIPFKLSKTSSEEDLERMLQVAAESNSAWEDDGLNGPQPVDATSPQLLPSSLKSEKHHRDFSTPAIPPELTLDVAVGVSKLYKVELPALQMVPIYWSSSRDPIRVIRATWFYKDTMYPVEPVIANSLELGYIATRPWRPWCEDLSNGVSSAVQGEASGEQSFLYKLRLEDEQAQKNNQDGYSSISEAHVHTEECLGPNYCADGGKANKGDAAAVDRTATIKNYLGSVVCYEDVKNASILRPGLEQSQYQRLRSLSRILGGSIGVQVIRGFDTVLWERLYPSKKLISPSGMLEPSKGKTSDGKISSSEPERSEITDLVFVVHGIGQKLSQRYEGYSFTHAITSLRQSINADLRNPTIREGLRGDFGGIAILPINWRQGFNFGDGGALLSGHNLSSASSSKTFGLNDITPHSIPTVRSLISDVLLDIPFYMSPHKAQMTEAVVKEANRIYRLWCHNNPSFKGNGRVHIIGHSLGSALCLDILSQQPTFVSPINVTDNKLTTKHFEFNTTNLFFIGSPVGFFLLLGSGKLLPRHGRKKPRMIIDDEKTKYLAGDEGTYGCLAVDNLYNIMHYEDPIAYRLNAAVDVEHAASLKKAEVPSATTASWWDTLQSITQSVPPLMPSFSTATTKATTIKQDTVESESPTPATVEPYRDEEVLSDAELRFHLLNDNGQIDYFLKAPEGPEIQYLNMLWAHGSYWSNLDFVRLLVMELGREPGREFALGAMMAVKEGKIEVEKGRGGVV